MAYKWQRNGKRAVKNGRDTAKSPLKTGGIGKVSPLKTGKKRAGIFSNNIKRACTVSEAREYWNYWSL